MSSDETKKKIVDATLLLAGTVGPLGLSVRTIAAKAGVGRSLLAYHFGTMGDLYREAFRVIDLQRPDGGWPVREGDKYAAINRRNNLAYRTLEIIHDFMPAERGE